MKILYSQHLEKRLQLRNIEYELPEIIFNRSNERYLDEETGHRIATITIELYGKIREILLAYVIEGDYVKFLTIPPLKEGQKEKRVRSGRWRRI